MTLDWTCSTKPGLRRNSRCTSRHISETESRSAPANGDETRAPPCSRCAGERGAAMVNVSRSNGIAQLSKEAYSNGRNCIDADGQRDVVG